MFVLIGAKTLFNFKLTAASKDVSINILIVEDERTVKNI